MEGVTCPLIRPSWLLLASHISKQVIPAVVLNWGQLGRTGGN
jgi:hypothetical protein